MSVQTELTRIQNARSTIRDTLVSWNKALSTDTLDVLATIISGIQNRGAVDVEIKEGMTYTIPEGYHNGSGVVTGIPGGGNYSLQSKSVTPTKSTQNIEPDEGKYGLSSVSVAAIPAAYQNVTSVTAVAGDVLATKVFVASDGASVAGTMANNGAVNLTIDGLTTLSASIPSGYTSGGSVALTNDILNILVTI